MDKYDICIGTIKKCLDIDKYGRFGEKYYSPDYKMNSMEMGTLVSTTIDIEEKAVLIRTLHGYIRVNDISNFFVNIRLTYELYDCILFNQPYKTGDLFIDESTIKPFYKKDNNQKVRIKTLKKDALKLQK